jgi:hypothetical protein
LGLGGGELMQRQHLKLALGECPDISYFLLGIGGYALVLADQISPAILDYTVFHTVLGLSTELSPS